MKLCSESKPGVIVENIDINIKDSTFNDVQGDQNNHNYGASASTIQPISTNDPSLLDGFEVCFSSLSLTSPSN